MRGTKIAKEERCYSFEQLRVRFWAGVYVGLLIALLFFIIITSFY